jgi:hypothetical protein
MNQTSKEILLALESDLEKIMVKGSEELKKAYFQFAMLVEKEAKSIGIHSLNFRKDLMRINNRPVEENVTIRKQDLLSVYPEIECEPAMKLFEAYNAIYKSSFFERMKAPYQGFVGLRFNDNEVRFENVDLIMEFKTYKAEMMMEQLTKDLSIENKKEEKKLKI